MTGTPGLRERARLDAWERIRSTAVALLSEKSLDDLTTREFAERAGVSEATLFRCVESKHDLLILAYGDRVDALLDRIEEADRRAAAAQPRPAGVSYCRRVLDAFWMRSELYLESPENGALYLHAGRGQREQESPSVKRGCQQVHRLVGLAAEIIREGQQARCLRGDFDADLIALNCHGSYRDEMEHSVKRGLDTRTFRDRVSARLGVQLFALVIDECGMCHQPER